MIDDQPEHFNPVAYKNDQTEAYKQVFTDQSVIIDPETQVKKQKRSSK